MKETYERKDEGNENENERKMEKERRKKRRDGGKVNKERERKNV